MAEWFPQIFVGGVALAILLARIVDKLIDRVFPASVVPADVLKTMEKLMGKVVESQTHITKRVNHIDEELAPDMEGVQRWKNPGIRRELDKQTEILIRIDGNIARLADNNPGSGGRGSL